MIVSNTYARVRGVARVALVLVAVVLSLLTLAARVNSAASQPIAAAHAINLSCLTLDPPSIATAYEVNSTLERDRGSITIEIFGSEDWSATVSYTDPTCVGHAVLGPIIADHLAATESARLTECADLAARLASGRVFIRDQELDIDKVRAYIADWC
jgi:hypothetical protein